MQNKSETIFRRRISNDTSQEIGKPVTQRRPTKCEIEINWFNLRASMHILLPRFQLYSDFDFRDDESKQKESSKKPIIRP